MRHIKKMMAALVVAVLAMTMCAGVAFAEDATSTSTPTLTQTPTNNLTADAKISVKGLEQGDTVTYYQVVKWDNGWVLGDEFAEGLSAADLAEIVGNKDNPGAISAAMAVKISQVESIVGTTDNTPVGDTGIWEKSGVAPGLYYVAVTPGVAGVVYNPIFVAADYYTNTSNEITLVNNGNSYSDNAMAKKTKVTLEKTSTTITEVPVGQDVDFTVATTIPHFGKAYTNPKFTLEDTMSGGLSVKTDTIAVKYKDSTGFVTVPESAYTLTAATAGYSVEFSKDYLQNLTVATDIQVTYKATIISEAAYNVNPEANTVTLNYSNNPSDTTGKGILRDKTNHYTFDIDADLLGQGTYKTTEVVKIGVDKDGNEITKTTTLSNGNTIGALEGAEFKLYSAYTDATTNTPYVNGKITADTIIYSGPDGRLGTKVNGAFVAGIKGLAAGTYYLVETKAPDGYIKATDPVTIVIEAKTAEKTYTDTEQIDGENVEVTYKANELVSYTVKINGVETAKYTMTNEKPDQGDKFNTDPEDPNGSVEGTTNVGDDANSGKIKNTQGVELPSTGGMGTTILYVVGGIMVLLAAVWLITKRRMSKTKIEEEK